MAATIGVATPFKVWKVLGGAAINAFITRKPEKSGQTFLQGTPVQVDVAGVTGFIIANPAIVSVATAVIAGIAVEGASNLTTSGVAQTQNLTNKVPNQPNAVITAYGAPINDGTVGIYTAADQMLFVGLLGNSNTAANATVAQADLGKIYGLTKDATTGFWYIDNFITTTAAGACVEVVELVDPVGTLNGREVFKITRAAQQLMT